MKRCQYCNTPLRRPPQFSRSRWRSRRYCSDVCYDAARSTHPNYTDEPVPIGSLPEGTLSERITYLLEAYYPLPLSGFEIIDVMNTPAPRVWAALDALERNRRITRTSGDQFAATTGNAHAGEA